jgi:4-nitrophenyl phosphatase
MELGESVSLAMRDIRHMLIDLDGVLFVGTTALPGAAEFISWLRHYGITFRLVTNNATLTPRGYVDKLHLMGIEVGEDEIFTSALATALYLHKQRGAQSAYVIGEEGLVEALRAAHVTLESEQPDWVVVGLDRKLTYDKLATGALALQRGARFLATNPDLSLPAEAGLVPGAGAIQAALTATTGIRPIVIGKPEPLMLELAMSQLGGSLADTVMLGDRLDTDIQGANTLGISSILILTGVSSRRDIDESHAKPSLVVENLASLVQRWTQDDVS